MAANETNVKSKLKKLINKQVFCMYFEIIKENEEKITATTIPQR